MENKMDSFIEVKLSPKGKYYWAIHCAFNEETTESTKVIGYIASADRQLKDKFPKNTAEIQSTSSRYSEIEEF